jgi:streptomycin 3"-kinase
MGESGNKVYRRSDSAAYIKISEENGIVFLNEERRRTEWLTTFKLGAQTVLDWTVSDAGTCLMTSAV